MKTERCGSCGVTDNVEPIEGRMPDHPPNWATLSIAAKPVINRLLCPRCVMAVQFLIGAR